MPRDESEMRTAPAFTAEYAQQGNASSGVSAAEQEYARMHREPRMSDAGVGESGEDLRQDSRPDGY
jgi:hypothetical protein